MSGDGKAVAVKRRAGVPVEEDQRAGGTHKITVVPITPAMPPVTSFKYKGMITGPFFKGATACIGVAFAAAALEARSGGGSKLGSTTPG